jgi:deoxyribodipyrimidine photo-lyase
MTNIVWLRQELRVSDNPALHGAVQEKQPLLPVFIWNPEATKAHMPGGASQWWLHHSLHSLSETLAALGSPLVICVGTPEQVLPELARKCKAAAVFWNRSCTPADMDDISVTAALKEAGIAPRIYSSTNYLIHFDDVVNNSGGPFKVFTPFYKRAAAVPASKPLPAPDVLIKPGNAPAGVPLETLKLLPKIHWTAGLDAAWQPGEAGAKLRLEQFIENEMGDYHDMRDYPAQAGTSKLSPHLHFGEITPGQILAAVASRCASEHDATVTFHTEAFTRQLYWREFGAYLLHYFPEMRHSPMRPEFERFPWRDDADVLKRWQQGQTGYPIVDAGLRELWHTGWMHNRVRMIVASFLVKHLLLPWQSGAAWFWDTLVDADIANNTLGWQWVSGCGPDAAPYFRIFNPILQGEKFDANGEYVRHWVPELANMDTKYIHAPWTAPTGALSSAGITLGENYPLPIVDHKEARQRALDAFAYIKG